MRIVTINIPQLYIDVLQQFIITERFNSRSQCVREALKEFLEREKTFTDELIQFKKS